MFTYQINIKGIVQGVGFRPFIWLLFTKNNICGFVTNTTDGVYIEANFKDKVHLKKIINLIYKNKPKPALIESITFKKIVKKNFTEFIILESFKTKEKFQLISPDIATCKDCQKEIYDKNNKRRYFYPFTNCTNCGPRFTIIKKMPYDRENTTMSEFEMCADCKSEYLDPKNRRFHAQPNACLNCGPKLILTDNKGKLIDEINPIKTAVNFIKQGKIVAIKSLGGFQIACNALSDSAVKKLRERKKRPTKPFAIMFKDINLVNDYLKINKSEENALCSSKAPIVLLKKKKKLKEKIKPLSTFISYNNKYEGAILPYTPLHHLLFKFLNIPLIMTSGNISEEPIASKNDEAINKLKNICDYFLIHNRDIFSKYDDSVIKVFKNKEMLIRRARGYAPYPIKLDLNIEDKVILAVGSQEKSNFCILVKNYAIVSQHIGDLETKETLDFFTESIDIYKELFGIEKFDVVVHDLHPDYLSTRFVMENFDKNFRLPLQHHQAHIASVIAENNLLKKRENFIGFSWDGTGFGTDSKIWGSEIFLIDKKLNFHRIGHLREKFLPGGDTTIKNPYRMAIVYLYEYFKKNNDFKDTKLFFDFILKNFKFYKNILNKTELDILISQIKSRYNSPLTTSMGRFFDAVSSILNITHLSTFEGEAAINLEMSSSLKTNESYKIKIDINKETKEGNLIEIDDFFIFNQIIIDLLNNIKIPVIAAKFHNTISKIVLDISLFLKNKYNISTILLSGGVFQNNILINKIYKTLEEKKFDVFTNFKVPVNDGGISLGQAYLAAVKLLNY